MSWLISKSSRHSFGFAASRNSKTFCCVFRPSTCQNHRDLNTLKRLFHQSLKSLLRTLHAVQVLFDRPFVQLRADLISEVSANLGIDAEQLGQLALMDEQSLDDSLDLVHSALINLIEIVAASATAVDQIPNQVELVAELEE